VFQLITGGRPAEYRASANEEPHDKKCSLTGKTTFVDALCNHVSRDEKEKSA
jgi:hypothetical protein